LTGKIQAIRGMHDILPDETAIWQYVEKLITNILKRYGYREIRFPIIEKTELFARSIGELTDIVTKEMYTFTDRNEDQLTLRPEGTASCVRAGIEHGLLYNQVQKLWYIGPMFRHERPQKGRQRQFHQIGVEAIGLDGPDIDAEIILICSRMWQELGLNNIELQLNSLGTVSSRNNYRQVLVAYLSDHKDQLDDDSILRLNTNPLRILDSKNPDMKKLLASAPVISEHLDQESVDHLGGLKSILDDFGLNYVMSPHLVRGLDYYAKTVFEWISDSLGAQGTICAGGRYDELVEHFGGKSTPACGFALGLERLIYLVQPTSQITEINTPHAYLIIVGNTAISKGLKIAENLRDALPGLRLSTNCGGGSFKNQFKKADKSGAKAALILGNDELENRTIGIKPLRKDAEQVTVEWDNLVSELTKIMEDI